MIDLPYLALALAAGLLLGLFYFAGLWLTVRRLPASRSPGLLMLCSHLLRTALVVAGLYVVSGGRWQALVACMLGFVLARAVLRWRVESSALQSESAGGGDGAA